MFMDLTCVYLAVVLSTFLAVFVVHPVQIIDGVHRVELDLCEVFVTDPVELRGGMGGRRPRHVVGSDGGSSRDHLGDTSFLVRISLISDQQYCYCRAHRVTSSKKYIKSCLI